MKRKGKKPAEFESEKCDAKEKQLHVHIFLYRVSGNKTTGYFSFSFSDSKNLLSHGG